MTVPNQTCSLKKKLLPRDTGLKGCGIRLFMDPENCWLTSGAPGAEEIAGTNVFFELCCLTELQETGLQRPEEEDDGCLADDATFTDLGPLKRTSLSTTVRDNYHKNILSPDVPVTGLDAVNTLVGLGGAFANAVRLAIEKNRSVAILIGTPGPGVICWEYLDVKVSEYIPQQKTKRGFRNSRIAMVPQSKAYAAVQTVDVDPFVFPAGFGTLQENC